jgi:hypothetical protein
MRRWVVFGRVRGLVTVELKDKDADGRRALLVVVPGVGEMWWPTRHVRPATWLESILGEFELGLRGLPGSL